MMKEVATAALIGAAALSLGACKSTPKSAEASVTTQGEQHKCTAAAEKHSCK